MTDKSNTTDPVRTSVEAWAAIAKENVTVETARVLFSGILNSSPIIDTFSTWLLVGSGATIALMITNIDRVIPVLTRDVFRTSLVLLAVSMLFGFAQKTMAVLVCVFISMEDRMYELSDKIFREHDKEAEEMRKMASVFRIELDADVDTRRVVDEFSRALPFYTRKSIVRNFEQGLKDRLAPHRINIRTYFRQSIYALLQSICLLILVLYVTIRLGHLTTG